MITTMKMMIKGISKGTGNGSLNTLLIVGGVVVLFVLGNKLFSKGGLFGFLLAPFSQPEALGDLEDKLEVDLKNVSVNSSKLSKTPNQIATAANSSYQAMRGFVTNNFSWGTDRDLLFDAISGFNADDLKAVYKEFGLREDFLLLVPIFKADLFGWYNAELSGQDLLDMKEIWKKTNLW